MRNNRLNILTLVTALLALLGAPAHAEETLYSPDALIVPMDTTYQDNGMLEAYGLVYQLLLNGVPVDWVIEPGKSYGAVDFNAAAEDLQTLLPVIDHGYRGGPFVVESSGPGSDRRRGNEKPAGRLRCIPSACGSQFKDGEALGRGIMGTPLGWNPHHASVLNPHLLGQQGNLLTEAVVVLFESDPGVSVVGGPAACIDDGEVGKGDSVDDGGTDALGPSRGQRKPGRLQVSSMGTSRAIG